MNEKYHIIKQNFNIDIKYRETYKLGTYYSEEKGFYIPHTDTQGGKEHRKISVVICISNDSDYEGGIFKFINLNKSFKFNKGDAIFFDSNLLHGVEPVIGGKRQVIISFMWDEQGENLRLKNTSTENKPTLNYIPQNIYDYSSMYHNKIISFSLWGDSEIYNYGMVENALVAKTLLPDFMLYVYHNNTVLQKSLNILKTLDNVRLINTNIDTPNASNMLWRFQPCFQSDSIVMVRDADSLINDRDKFVITDFLNSDKQINIIRDTGVHSKYNILGGMWGTKNGVLKKYFKMYNEFKILEDTRGIDIVLLSNIYEIEKNNCIVYIPLSLKDNCILRNETDYKIIEASGHFIGSYNYYAPLTRKLFNEENTKLSTKRFYNWSSNKNYIAFIAADSGPGNQIVGLKECLILSKLLNRTCIIPPIREHYLKSNTIFYDFNDIFKLNIDNIIIDNSKHTILNNEIFTNTYTLHASFLDKKLKSEYIINKNYNTILLKTLIIKEINNLDELKSKTDRILVLRHLFNNVAINDCVVNGCFSCSLNNVFIDIYKNICSKFDYSDTIKKIGNKFIQEHLNNGDYVALHLRLPDVFGNKTIDELTNGEYTNDIINNILISLKNKHNKPFYIASNNTTFIKKIFNDFINYNNINQKYASFIEQYICCKSNIFYYLNADDLRITHKHNRSTYTSFILDYRLYFDNKSVETNINLRKNGNLKIIQ